MTQIVVMGVSGAGKTTVGELLADRLEAGFLDADDYHPESNRQKMASSIPLTDEDRRPWLRRLGAVLRDRAAAGDRVVLACSALRRAYRDLLRETAGDVFFVHLDASGPVIAERLRSRSGHFMSPALLDSQLATLEPLEADEPGVVVDVTGGPDRAADAAVAALASRGLTG